MLHFNDTYHCLIDWSINILKYNNKTSDNYICKNPHINYNIDDIKNYFYLNKQKIYCRITYCENIWKKFEREFEICMKEIFHTNITIDSAAYVTFFPLYPRDLGSRAFLIPFEDSDDRTISIIVHEQIHFYYYHMLDRYKIREQINRNSSFEKEAINENLIWLISEIMIPLVFEYMMKKYSFNDLRCSQYCFNELQREKVRKHFKDFLSRGDLYRFLESSSRSLSEVS